jgi:hypothetical protein
MAAAIQALFLQLWHLSPLMRQNCSIRVPVHCQPFPPLSSIADQQLIAVITKTIARISEV